MNLDLKKLCRLFHMSLAIIPVVYFQFCPVQRHLPAHRVAWSTPVNTPLSSVNYARGGCCDHEKQFDALQRKLAALKENSTTCKGHRTLLWHKEKVQTLQEIWWWVLRFLLLISSAHMSLLWAAILIVSREIARLVWVGMGIGDCAGWVMVSAFCCLECANVIHGIFVFLSRDFYEFSFQTYFSTTLIHKEVMRLHFLFWHQKYTTQHFNLSEQLRNIWCAFTSGSKTKLWS